MDNKTLINLDNNLMLKSENIEYDNDTLKNILDNLTFEDVTSRFNFINCTLNSGKILKFGRLVFMQIQITPTITNGWGNVVQNLPEDLWPIVLQDEGAAICGSEFWVYGLGKGTINGSIVAGTSKNISGFYILKN